MTSIIGYTRTFHPSCSIAPVQRHCPNRPALNRTDHTDQVVTRNEDNAAKKPNYHRMFSRELTTPNGMIELIIDKKPLSLQSSKITINTAMAVPDKKILNQQVKNNNSIPQYKDYNTYLAIDLSGKHDYDEISSSTTSFDSIQRLMDSISKMKHKKSIKFVNIIELLRQLQRYQHEYQFMSCIDKQNEKILVYFPNSLSVNIHGTRTWLKQVVGVDCEAYDYWHLICSNEEEEEDDVDAFDGKKYFKEINMFIDQVDALMESNGLFSHKQKN
ncbi:uncharacterized protein B0P05DRAFT_556249 [Gilbertella persicaria]|uniref:uncharacterized protein n=1 Tax=Gilbertella persicaria TaxID=101096 RepID=UPI00221E7BF0|nr:uncharacterized protein B0P05DRAFT_556249 [Gilbertella persicaria]KAI8062823.1 hypothetical protein B0P05DRAFT_556249 [Gilbertella persicaria]